MIHTVGALVGCERKGECACGEVAEAARYGSICRQPTPLASKVFSRNGMSADQRHRLGIRTDRDRGGVDIFHCLGRSRVLAKNRIVLPEAVIADRLRDHRLLVRQEGSA